MPGPTINGRLRAQKARVEKASKDGETKDSKVKAKVEDDKDKTDVKAHCRKKKRDDEERKTTLAQNSLTSSLVATSPPGLTNVPTSTSGASISSLRQSLSRLTSRMMMNFHCPTKIFALKASSPTDRVMDDLGAAHSACPADYANEHEVREVQHNSRRPAENYSSTMVRKSSRTWLKTPLWESRIKSLTLNVQLRRCPP